MSRGDTGDSVCHAAAQQKVVTAPLFISTMRISIAMSLQTLDMYAFGTSKGRGSSSPSCKRRQFGMPDCLDLDSPTPCLTLSGSRQTRDEPKMGISKFKNPLLSPGTDLLFDRAQTTFEQV